MLSYVCALPSDTMPVKCQSQNNAAPAILVAISHCITLDASSYKQEPNHCKCVYMDIELLSMQHHHLVTRMVVSSLWQIIKNFESEENGALFFIV